MVSEARRLSWRELAGLEERKTTEALVWMKGRMGKETSQKVQESLGSEESELEKVGSENSPAGGIAEKKAQEAFEQLATVAMVEGGVLDKLMETMAVICGRRQERR